ncbi:DUF3515 family protein [Galbitalea soli]|uniref:DUF3515 family protein n=2 Tax=Galbitalea soli TaxID=1268042 RepID=A0A7C9TQR9_9MICO|nr:DUF3515 family protein [Galbitalea soli]
MTALAAALAATLTACTPTVALEPAAHATAVACASLVTQLPDTVAGLPSRETNAQGTGAWGDPAEVLLRCGVAVPGPTSTLECVTVNGVDWLSDPSQEPDFVFTSYGRNPAVQVIIIGSSKLSGATVSGQAVLTDLSNAMGEIPQKHKCIGPSEQYQNGEPVDPSATATPTPTPSPSR